jgi:BirA family biotin operon repressor/biotin-[acetyl-CoA-carboxylase] ligase
MRNRWIKHDSLPSTNSYISDRLRLEALDEGSVVVADYQDAGRGLGEHSWVSNRGENLLMSLLLFPAFLSASRQFYLSRVASLALCDALETLGLAASIKWPNDILTEKGKIAGILIEHGITGKRISHSVVGLGLNLNQTVFPGFPVPATSLALESGRQVDVTEVGELVESSLMNRYQELKDGAFQSLEKGYMDKLFKAGVPTLFKEGNELFEGSIRGVNDFGELLVERKGELRSYGHGSINMELNFA